MIAILTDTLCEFFFRGEYSKTPLKGAGSTILLSTTVNMDSNFAYQIPDSLRIRYQEATGQEGTMKC